MVVSNRSAALDCRLTPKQVAFVREYLATGNAAESYRRAYPNANPATPQDAAEEGWRLLHNPKIAHRIAEHQQEAAACAQLTHTHVLASLRDNAEHAQAEGYYAASNRALELLAKYLGLFSGRRE